MWKRYIKNSILDIVFPKSCLNCGKEGSYLCDDCNSCLEISPYIYCLCEEPKRLFEAGKCRACRSKKLDGLYSALPYQNNLVQKLIHNFKYEPFIKELANPLSSLIISHFQYLENPPEFIKHFQLLDNKPDFSSFVLISVPLHKKRLKWRGFNQAEEIAKELAQCLDIPLLKNCLFKLRETPPQMELSGEEREKNIKNVFIAENKETVQDKKILLVDDVYTTGSTMEECARVLKEGGAKEVIGLTVARES